MNIKEILLPILMLLVFIVPAEAKDDWNEHRARHFYIYYKDAPKDFVKSVEKAAEGYYEDITRNLGFTRYKGWSFDDRAKIYIYSDQDEYVASARVGNWSQGAANARLKIIRTFPAAHGFFDSTLPHELGHIIFREFVGFYSFLPLWLDEGVAMYQEKAKRWGVNKAVKEAIANGNFIPLPELSKMRVYSNSDKALIDLFYAESASVVYFMITELGEYRFSKFCRKLKDKQTFEQALKSAYVRFKSVDDLNKAWLNYLEKQ